MYLEKASPFIRMLLGALLGTVLGIIFGLLFGLIIAWATSNLFPKHMGYDPGSMPYEMASFLGMGAGAIIGSILGGIYGNKK